MNWQGDVSLLLNVIGLGQSLMLIVLLIFRKSVYAASNRILALLILAFSIIIFNTIVRLTHYVDLLDFIQDFSNASLLLIAPSIYLYIKLRIESVQIRLIMIHYLLFIVYATYLIIYLNTEKTLAGRFDKEVVDAIAFISFNIQFITYSYFSYQQLNSFDRNARESYSSLDQISLKWIKEILITFNIIWIGQIGILIYDNTVSPLPDIIKLNVSLAFVVSVCILAYKSFSKTDVFIKLPSYEGKSMSEINLSETKASLDHIMNEHRLYLDPKLTLAIVAEKINLSSRHISQVINQQTGNNFYDYVNAFRVDEFKRSLKSSKSDQFTLNALAQDAGFQSMSSFYTTFKKMTGLTPKQYKNSLN